MEDDTAVVCMGSTVILSQLTHVLINLLLAPSQASLAWGLLNPRTSALRAIAGWSAERVGVY